MTRYYLAIFAFIGSVGWVGSSPSLAGGSADPPPFPDPVHVLGKEHILHQIEDMALSGRDAYIVTQPSPIIHHFRAGSLIDTWGAEGNGPGEFTNPRSISVTPTSAIVADLRPARLTWFSLGGVLRSTARYANLQLATQVEARGDLVLLEISAFTSRSKRVFKADSSGHATEVFAYMEPPSIDLDPSEGPSLSVSSPFADADAWTLLPSSVIARYTAGSSEIQIMERDGSTRANLALPPDSYSVNEKDQEAWLLRTMNPDEVTFGRRDLFKGARELARTKLDFPDTFPPVLELESDPTGGIWVLRADRVAGQVWTRLSQSGEEAVTVSFPPGRRVHVFGSEYIAASTTDASGRELVELFRRDEVLEAAAQTERMPSN